MRGRRRGLVVRVSTPCEGDLVALTFDPQAGHDQRGRRPALLVSNDLFNRRTGLCVVCPVTSARRDFTFHVLLPGDCRVQGVAMVEQVTSVDFRRGARSG